MPAFNVQNPGAKEYLIVGGAALAIGYFVISRRSKTAAPPQTAQQQPPNAPQPVSIVAQGNGIPRSALQATIQDQQSSPTPALRPATTINLAPWKAGLPESQQAWNADLNNIAAHYGISHAALVAANPQIQNPQRIAPGTIINIPAG